MKVFDLFAGIGGFSLAAHWMGWQTVAFVEKEPFCQKVLRKNFGQAIEIHDDIFKFSGQSFRGQIDIITGGFPCQPFSAAGKREGRNDERHLWPEMLRVIQEVQPAWIVAENVRGLLSIESGRVFAEIITSLESEGYEVITFCIPASAVEAPHRRDRLWIVAHSDIDQRNREKPRSLEPQISEAETKRSGDYATGQLRRADELLSTNRQFIGYDRVTPHAKFARTGRESGEVANERRPASESGRAGIRSGNGQAGTSGIDAADCDVANTRNARLPFTGSGSQHEGSFEQLRDDYRQKNITANADAKDARRLRERTPPKDTRDSIYYRGIADSDSWRLEGTETERWNGINAVGQDVDDPDTASIGFQRSIANPSLGFARGQGYGSPITRDGRSQWSASWLDVATTTCIRGMDDGLSAELDIVGSRDSRVPRLKALGNAIVPQIAFEIFKAIEQIQLIDAR